ncbi:MAG: hypothetical protein Q8O28_10115 [Smithellaceae bacterium]|nr:hypothetical protein [Smithellaceae bacterium]
MKLFYKEKEIKLPESQLRYIDRPEISETFVDPLGVVTFDGNTRLELCATRLAPQKQPNPPTARQISRVSYRDDPGDDGCLIQSASKYYESAATSGSGDKTGRATTRSDQPALSFL